ncbi:Mbeg1-like protein [Saccharibacillus alkalitolerans]|uniref:DUF2974 domain-containing protein n=1 Tax=Saccharibacillus alkalitolerans TaxID=2705290 RepID=A0ABX0FBK4_9BACL|nr:Mbeg1-like protein [Saccharibacillus alkalitolerans]NGZ77653.1 DUF2974 domain-containing protein [Saccharibacillus alkalitolerans]
MGDMITYLKWRGDLSLKERPFNEVDNLILSSISYFDWEGILPDPTEKRSVTVQEAWEALHEKEAAPTLERFRRLNIIDEALLQAMADSERFKNVKLSCFVERMDEIEVTQFAALMAELDDDTCYIAYRGTDNSILGWREDFSLSFQTVSAQLHALEYLESVVRPGRSYRVGGHSKGGNLAMYAAMMCSESANDRIIEVYNNDGPGFCQDLPCAAHYDRIKHKLIRLVPEFSVIGMLFASQDSDLRIVGSRAEGLKQHLPLTWEVERSAFVSKPDLTKRCKFSFGFPVEKSFIVKDDQVYGAVGFNPRAMANGSKFYKLDSAGKQRWEVVLDGFVYMHGFVNDKLLVYNQDAAYAIDKNGKVAWKKEIPKNGASEYKSIKNLYNGGFILATSSGRHNFAEITDWNMKTKIRYTLPEKNFLRGVQPFGKDLYVVQIQQSDNKQLLVAIDQKGQTKWKRSIDSSTNRLYVLDGKLMYANNAGFFALNAKGETLHHSPLDPLDPLPGSYSYVLEADKDRIYVHSLTLAHPLSNYMYVYDRKTLTLSESFGNPTKRIQDPDYEDSETGTYYDALFYDKDQLYVLIFNNLKKLKVVKE